jgi:hypothetical protein
LDFECLGDKCLGRPPCDMPADSCSLCTLGYEGYFSVSDESMSSDVDEMSASSWYLNRGLDSEVENLPAWLR